MEGIAQTVETRPRDARDRPNTIPPAYAPVNAPMPVAIHAGSSDAAEPTNHSDSISRRRNQRLRASSRSSATAAAARTACCRARSRSLVADNSWSVCGASGIMSGTAAANAVWKSA